MPPSGAWLNRPAQRKDTSQIKNHQSQVWGARRGDEWPLGERSERRIADGFARDRRSERKILPRKGGTSDSDESGSETVTSLRSEEDEERERRRFRKRRGSEESGTGSDKGAAKPTQAGQGKAAYDRAIRRSAPGAEGEARRGAQGSAPGGASRSRPQIAEMTRSYRSYGPTGSRHKGDPGVYGGLAKSHENFRDKGSRGSKRPPLQRLAELRAELAAVKRECEAERAIGVAGVQAPARATSPPSPCLRRKGDGCPGTQPAVPRPRQKTPDPEAAVTTLSPPANPGPAEKRRKKRRHPPQLRKRQPPGSGSKQPRTAKAPAASEWTKVPGTKEAKGQKKEQSQRQRRKGKEEKPASPQIRGGGDHPAAGCHRPGRLIQGRPGRAKKGLIWRPLTYRLSNLEWP
ncbi:serine/arginine repetitive matrix protein 1-like [Danaus plexippus]|uniref:serine/arginine repetitive matrix protein 1-like n=1 Tax=Danaus plexippus TaxID=13037 RepID=UPI002AAF0C28|nr:serine/arginine repetitive matrix protein 1-like [Danaus plexippus]